MNEEERDKLYEETMALEWQEPNCIEDFIRTHEMMQMAAKQMVDNHPVKQEIVARLDRFGTDAKSLQKKQEYMKKHLHLPGSRPETCKYCKHLVDFFDKDMAFEEKCFGTHRILEGDKRDHFRRQIELIAGVFNFMKRHGEI